MEVSTDTIENEGINISILDIIGRQKIARLNIRQKDDTSFISNIRSFLMQIYKH